VLFQNKDIVSKKNPSRQDAETFNICLSIQEYENRIYTLYRIGPIERMIIVFDDNFKELLRWSVSKCSSVSQLAVCLSKIYVSNPDCHEISVYSLSGTNLKSVSLPTFNRPRHLCVYPPHCIIVASPSDKRISKLDCREDSIVWSTTAVLKPTAIGSCMKKQEVWVKSFSSRFIFILDAETGKSIYFFILYNLIGTYQLNLFNSPYLLWQRKVLQLPKQNVLLSNFMTELVLWAPI